jgi:hypothetical protein
VWHKRWHTRPLELPPSHDFVSEIAFRPARPQARHLRWRRPMAQRRCLGSVLVTMLFIAVCAGKAGADEPVPDAGGFDPHQRWSIDLANLGGPDQGGTALVLAIGDGELGERARSAAAAVVDAFRVAGMARVIALATSNAALVDETVAHTATNFGVKRVAVVRTIVGQALPRVLVSIYDEHGRLVAARTVTPRPAILSPSIASVPPKRALGPAASSTSTVRPGKPRSRASARDAFAVAAVSGAAALVLGVHGARVYRREPSVSSINWNEVADRACSEVADREPCLAGVRVLAEDERRTRELEQHAKGRRWLYGSAGAAILAVGATVVGVAQLRSGLELSPQVSATSLSASVRVAF